MPNFDLDSTYKIHNTIYLTGNYIQNRFEGLKVGRNVERAFEDADKRNFQLTNFFDLCFFQPYNFEQNFINELFAHRFPQNRYPLFFKFLKGEEIVVDGNTLDVFTTELNFTNLEKAVKLLMNRLCKFPAEFMHRQVDVSLVEDSVFISEFENFYEKHWCFDEYENASKRYKFSISFSFRISLKEPLKESQNLKRYEGIIKVFRSKSILQIVKDCMENPGRFTLSKDGYSIFLRSESYDEAKEFFSKRVFKGMEMRIGTFAKFILQNFKDRELKKSLQVFKLLHYRNCNAYQVTSRDTVLLHLQFMQLLSDKDCIKSVVCYQEMFERIRNFLTKSLLNVDSILNNSEEMNNFKNECWQLQVNLKSCSKSASNICIVDLCRLTDVTCIRTNMKVLIELFEDLLAAFETLKNILKQSPKDCLYAAASYYADVILMDPFSYINHENESVSIFARSLLNGFES